MQIRSVVLQLLHVVRRTDIMKPRGAFFTHCVLMVPSHSYSEELRVIAYNSINKFLYIVNES